MTNAEIPLIAHSLIRGLARSGYYPPERAIARYGERTPRHGNLGYADYPSYPEVLTSTVAGPEAPRGRTRVSLDLLHELSGRTDQLTPVRQLTEEIQLVGID